MKSPYGNEVTAQDYKWAWERRWQLKGVGKFIGDVVGIASPDSITVLDKYTVRVNLKGPSPIFFKILAQNYYGGPLDSTEVKKHATADEPWGKEWTRIHSAGFGPYQVERVVPGVETVLVPNPNWTLTPVYFQRIILKAVPESSARLSLLKAGQVDLIPRVSQALGADIEKTANLQLLKQPYSSSYQCVAFNIRKPPFDDLMSGSRRNAASPERA